MRNLIKRPLGRAAELQANQKGITGLETAIELIAFVVVASVFAFAVLSTGLLSSEKSKETVLGGLEETSSTISVRGSVIGDSNSAKTFIDTVKFTLSSAAQASDAVDLSTTGVVVTYLDDNQAINCENPQSFDGDADTAECSWATSWVIGSGDLVDPGEQVDMTITLTNLSPLLPKSREFTIQVKPNKGAVVIVNRTTPPELKAIMELN
ncbi:MAG TPA: hypothetical protein EYM54_00215 [Dehalococcoidia bacterium]|jgi:flagellin FlaB|nr:hypothetical protein [Dehalococcoidia bacterium]|tara:strand:+ start:258 stop:884 length:627 start_codon:yes stop_codon:yes gene_type:complete